MLATAMGQRPQRADEDPLVDALAPFSATGSGEALPVGASSEGAVGRNPVSQPLSQTSSLNPGYEAWGIRCSLAPWLSVCTKCAGAPRTVIFLTPVIFISSPGVRVVI